MSILLRKERSLGVESEMPFISFSGKDEKLCVNMIDIVSSTAVTARLSVKQTCNYYSMFLNFAADIAQRHGATIAKNVGDSLLYYFMPKDERCCCLDSVLCDLEMIKLLPQLNEELTSCNLPPIRCRISADYGPTMIAESPFSSSPDVFGPTVNMCAKINHFAPPDSLVIGGDLYQLVRKRKECSLRLHSNYNSGMHASYPIYIAESTK